MLAQIDSTQLLIFEIGIVAAVFVVLLLLGRGLKRFQRVPLGLSYVFFSAALAVWLPLRARAITLGFPDEWRTATLRHAGAVAVALGTFVVIALLRRYYWELWWERRMRGPSPKFLSQLAALLIFVLGACFALAVEGVDVTAVSVSAGVLVAVAGFAAQATLENTVAGVALQASKPFKVGDWLIVENRHAEVMEMNWRSTRLRDNDDVYFDIPNKTLVTSTITNLTHPRRRHGVRIRIGFEYSSPPNEVKELLRRATRDGAGVLAEPEPKVFLKEFADSSIVYEIRFFMEDEALYNDILDSVKTNVWYEARRAGLTIPFPIRTLHIEKPKATRQEAIDRARHAAAATPLLAALGQETVDRLLMSARLERFGRGERIIRQGEPGDSMFLFLEGEAAVSIAVNGASKEVAKLRAGDCAGEMSLLTGEPRSATVTAATDCEVWELDKETVAPLLHENAALAEKLSGLLAERKMRTEGLVAAQQPAATEAKHAEYKKSFLGKLYAFFDL